MRFSICIAAVLANVFLVGTVNAKELIIGVAAPLTGTSALLGKQVETGATLSAKAGEAELKIVDDACTADGGASAANAFVAAKVKIVVGFLCTDAIEAALPILKEAGIPAVTVGVRTESLTDRRAKTGWPIFRLGPRGDDERNAAATILAKRWYRSLFAIVDDGTIYGREIAETFRAAAKQAALKPVFVDTFRPALDNQIALVGRLKRAGATHVFAGGDGNDIAIMSRDAKELGADIVFAGGEALREPLGGVPLAAGTLMIALPEWADVADKNALEAFASANVIAEGYALPAYAAVQIAQTAIQTAKAGENLMETLSNQTYSTAIGSIHFDEKGDLMQNPYRAFRFDGSHFVPVEGD